MELKFVYAIYICIAILVLLILIRFKKAPFSEGKKISGLTFIEKDSSFKRKMIAYKVLVYLLKGCCVAAIIASFVLIARPYKTEISIKDEMNRDIILCMDVSTSVDSLNETLCDKLIETVENLHGERFGIVIFNTTPVLLCPLTDDYEYVIECLSKTKQALQNRNSYYANYDDEWLYLNNYISSGTLKDNDKRGSSLIADGLASTIINFPGIDTDTDRSRVVIFTTDNDPQGESLMSLQEAADILKRKKVICYGIAPFFIYSDEKAEMQRAMETTGGQLYIENQSGTVQAIVENINKLETSRIETKKDYRDIEYPALPFIILLISVSGMIVLTKITKL